MLYQNLETSKKNIEYIKYGKFSYVQMNQDMIA